MPKLTLHSGRRSIPYMGRRGWGGLSRRSKRAKKLSWKLIPAGQRTESILGRCGDARKVR